MRIEEMRIGMTVGFRNPEKDGFTAETYKIVGLGRDGKGDHVRIRSVGNSVLVERVNPKELVDYRDYAKARKTRMVRTFRSQI